MDLSPIVLVGQHVRLEPLSQLHHPRLLPAALDESLWRWTLSSVRSSADLERYIDQALTDQRAGTALPFAIVHTVSGAAIGSTRFGNADHAHRRVEIGWSWVVPAHQRTAANTEAKYLLLRHAFERLGCVRVEFKTDALNTVSRAALARIGAVEEGTLRRHLITDGGRRRDSVYFSVIEEEWPAVAATLRQALHAG